MLGGSPPAMLRVPKSRVLRSGAHRLQNLPLDRPQNYITLPTSTSAGAVPQTSSTLKLSLNTQEGTPNTGRTKETKVQSRPRKNHAHTSTAEATTKTEGNHLNDPESHRKSGRRAAT